MAAMEPGLERLFDPQAIVVVGASADPGKWGYQYARSLLKGRDRRRVFLVNARVDRVLDEPAWRSCADLPSAPDVAVVCVPLAATEAAVRDAVAAGCRFVVCVTAGFAELGPEGRRRQADLVQMVRDAGARLVGPNCLGLVDHDSGLECTSFWSTARGPVGLVSQSGTVLLELSSRCADVGLGLARAVSMGNQADLSAAEFLRSFAGHAGSRAVVAYLEDLKSGRELFLALEHLVSSGRPCVVLAPGVSDATSRAVASHTGSMLGSDAAIDSACADIGVVRVRSIGAAVRALRGMLAPARSRGRRVAAVADGGGAAVLAADACMAAGLQVPGFSPALQQRVRDGLLPGAGVSNPVDAVGALCLTDMQPAIEAILAADEVDAVLLAGALNNVDRVEESVDRATVQQIVAAAVASGKGLAVAAMWPQEVALQEFARLGVPVSTDVVECTHILRDGAVALPRRAMPGMPPPAATAGVVDTGYFGSRRLFAEVGVPFVAAEEVHSVDAALAAAERIGYPVVLKALGMLHKSDAGGVAIGLADAGALRQAVEDFTVRLAPPSLSVEAMARTGDGVELLVGCVRQPGVGPVIACGIGGTLTEVVHDTVAALAPVDAAYARGMLDRLRGRKLLEGFRGRPAVDLDACARAIAGFSRLLFLYPGLAEAEINPLLATAGGVLALDARVVVAGSGSGDH